ncbi:hypothetical protein [Anaerobacillus sp. 1_MG-2023]|uniref:hypothetical protein n=1 Tax=Bacillales TaxID=1385 RepID=UPI0026E1A003|nr:hypothetical protein [Anaerobacillus sp. 1_MG-2023]MDO6656031.1 hypothetical protein [Anaerobacillus sp. 1_MG-2023]
MQFVLALIGGGLLLLILTLVPMNLTIIQKTWVAGLGVLLSMLLLVVKGIYPLPLAILLVFLCACGFMYLFWKKANYLFVQVQSETSVAMDVEETNREGKSSFLTKSIKDTVESDDNSRKKDDDVETDERTGHIDEEQSTEHELFLKIDQIDEMEDDLKETEESTETLDEELEKVESIEEVNQYIANIEENDKEETLPTEDELSELEEMEDIDFSARMETVYEEEEVEEEEEELDGFFEDFIREAEQEEVGSENKEHPDLAEEVVDEKDPPTRKELSDISSQEEERKVQRMEEKVLDEEENESSILIVEQLDLIEDEHEEEEQVNLDNSDEAVERSVEVASRMFDLLHDQAKNYKESGFVKEYEQMTQQLLSSELDDVMYFSVAAEYRDYLMQKESWNEVLALLNEMETRCQYPLLEQEIHYLQSMIQNKMMK